MKYPHTSSVRASAVERKPFLIAGKILLLALLAALLTFSQSHSAEKASARAVGMGGAHIGLAMGVDAARYNPANLGLAGYQSRGIELFGLGANISNNAFSLGDYNKYTGAFLTDGDKDYLLGRVPDEGLSVVADVEAAALATSSGPLVFSVALEALADANVSKDVIDLILNGNSFADVIDLTGTYLDAVGYVSAGLSYGMPIYEAGTRQVAVGATVKYIKGLAVERIVDLEGMLATYATGFSGDGYLTSQTSTGGTGYALDIGAAIRLNDSYTAGWRVKNFLSTVSWTRETEEHGYLFSFDTMTVENMNEDYIVSDDYTKDIPPFSTTLPSVMTVGLARTSGSLLWALDWEQGFRRAAGSSSKPRIAGGVEWWVTPVIPLRGGFATGGSENTAFSVGTGLNLPLFYLDLALVTGTGFSPYSAKELNFALSTGFHF